MLDMEKAVIGRKIWIIDGEEVCEAELKGVYPTPAVSYVERFSHRPLTIPFGLCFHTEIECRQFLISKAQGWIKQHQENVVKHTKRILEIMSCQDQKPS